MKQIVADVRYWISIAFNFKNITLIHTNSLINDDGLN
jgi:hypothetical protein